MAALLTVRTPVEGYTGIVAGVPFADGVGRVDPANRSALRYFAQHGYTVGADEFLDELDAADPAVDPTGQPEPATEQPPAAPAGGSTHQRPAANASKADWLTYAIARGIDPDDAAALKRDDLVALFDQEG